MDPRVAYKKLPLSPSLFSPDYVSPLLPTMERKVNYHSIANGTGARLSADLFGKLSPPLVREINKFLSISDNARTKLAARFFHHALKDTLFTLEQLIQFVEKKLEEPKDKNAKASIQQETKLAKTPEKTEETEQQDTKSNKSPQEKLLELKNALISKIKMITEKEEAKHSSRTTTPNALISLNILLNKNYSLEDILKLPRSQLKEMQEQLKHLKESECEKCVSCMPVMYRADFRDKDKCEQCKCLMEKCVCPIFLTAVIGGMVFLVTACVWGVGAEMIGCFSRCCCDKDVGGSPWTHTDCSSHCAGCFNPCDFTDSAKTILTDCSAASSGVWCIIKGGSMYYQGREQVISLIQNAEGLLAKLANYLPLYQAIEVALPKQHEEAQKTALDEQPLVRRDSAVGYKMNSN